MTRKVDPWEPSRRDVLAGERGGPPSTILPGVARGDCQALPGETVGHVQSWRKG